MSEANVADIFFSRESRRTTVSFNRDLIQSSLTEIVSSIRDERGPVEAVTFFNKLQPLLMEILFLEGYTVGLNNFNIPGVIKDVHGGCEVST